MFVQGKVIQQSEPILIRTTQLRLEDIKKILHDDIHHRVRSLDFEIVIARLICRDV